MQAPKDKVIGYYIIFSMPNDAIIVMEFSRISILGIPGSWTWFCNQGIFFCLPDIGHKSQVYLEYGFCS